MARCGFKHREAEGSLTHVPRLGGAQLASGLVSFTCPRTFRGLRGRARSCWLGEQGDS